MIIDILSQFSEIFGVPIFGIVTMLAVCLFITFSVFSWLTVGSRFGVVFGIIPIMLGVMVGVFPFYFLPIVCLIIITILLIPTRKRKLSYQEHVAQIELEMHLKQYDG